MIPPTVLVADDHPLFREALKLAVSRAAPGALILEAGQLGDAARIARDAGPLDLILLDLRMPGAEGFSGVALMHAERPDTPILVVSSTDEFAAAPRARAYGAVGFVPKTSDLAALQNAVERALSGARDPSDQSPSEPELEQMAGKIAALTPAEIRVLLGVLRGQLNKQIAFDLSISEATVKGHMTVIMRKMNVSNRTQAVLAARALDIQLSD